MGGGNEGQEGKVQNVRRWKTSVNHVMTTRNRIQFARDMGAAFFLIKSYGFKHYYTIGVLFAIVLLSAV